MIYKKSFWLTKITDLVIKKMDSPFLNHYFSKMDLCICTNIPTCAVKGNTIFLNPSFIGQFDQKQLVALIKHELMHHQMMNQK